MTMSEKGPELTVPDVIGRMTPCFDASWRNPTGQNHLTWTIHHPRSEAQHGCDGVLKGPTRGWTARCQGQDGSRPSSFIAMRSASGLTRLVLRHPESLRDI